MVIDKFISGGTHRKPITSDAGGHTHTFSGTTGNPSNTGTNSQGSSATNANLPPYYSLAYIIQYAQGGTTNFGKVRKVKLVLQVLVVALVIKDKNRLK